VIVREPPNPSGYCLCGCGKRTPLAKTTNANSQTVKGEHTRYFPGHKGPRKRRVLPSPNPSGLCFCGCGQKTPRATRTRAYQGYVEGEHVQYARGHSSRCQGSPVPLPNPSGLCMCGCGAKTLLARYTSRKGHTVKGEPSRYVLGHCAGRKPARRTRNRLAVLDAGPNPGGRCMCGCGQKTAIASSDDPRRGQVRGTPKRYVQGHGQRHSEKAQAVLRAVMEKNAERAVEARARWAPVVEDYKRGLVYREIMEKHDMGRSTLTHILRRWRELVEPDLPRRAAPVQRVLLARFEREGRVSKKAAAKVKITKLSDRRSDAECEAELAALVAEQEVDAELGNFVPANGTVSLDRPIADGGSLHDLLTRRAA
jgi:transposase